MAAHARTFTFAGQVGQRRFKLLYLGFVQGGLLAGARSLDTLRREASICDKLHAISIEEPAAPSQRELFGDNDVVFEQAEIELLRERLPLVTWSPAAAPGVVDLYDWLGTGEPAPTTAV